MSFSIDDPGTGEMLMASLMQAGFEGFEEEGETLFAYISRDEYDEAAVQHLAKLYNIVYSTEIVPPQNWNAQWEANFSPVIIEGFCTVRASFHDIPVNTPYEVVITPKMSFGTGHHATTRLMLQQMRDVVFTGKKVLDFGTGTGILAIMAAKLGAPYVWAIDNDEWSYENTMENIGANDCTCINVSLGTLDIAGDAGFDIILANINRHILLQYMGNMYKILNERGSLLISGLLEEDEEIICAAAASEGFIKVNKISLNNWICILLNK